MNFFKSIINFIKGLFTPKKVILDKIQELEKKVSDEASEVANKLEKVKSKMFDHNAEETDAHNTVLDGLHGLEVRLKEEINDVKEDMQHISTASVVTSIKGRITKLENKFKELENIKNDVTNAITELKSKIEVLENKIEEMGSVKDTFSDDTKKKK